MFPPAAAAARQGWPVLELRSSHPEAQHGMESWSERAPADGPDTARGPSTDRLRVALDAVLQAVAAPAASLDRLRRVVVRYGALACEQAVQLEEMLSTLTRGVRAVLAGLPAPRQDEVLAVVQWWAVHGYHRAD